MIYGNTFFIRVSTVVNKANDGHAIKILKFLYSQYSNNAFCSAYKREMILKSFYSGKLEARRVNEHADII